MKQDSKVVSVRVSLHEYEILQAMGKAFGMSVSKLIHEMLSIGFDIVEKPLDKALSESKKEGQ